MQKLLAVFGKIPTSIALLHTLFFFIAAFRIELLRTPLATLHTLLVGQAVLWVIMYARAQGDSTKNTILTLIFYVILTYIGFISFQKPIDVSLNLDFIIYPIVGWILGLLYGLATIPKRPEPS